ncbi:MAG: AAA family ATPase, partial [Bacteroidota bacterium]
LKILLTGSSSLELVQQTREALTGRTWTYLLYPIAISELAKQMNRFELQQQLEAHWVYGSYPELLTIENQGMKRRYLQELTTAYLYKDILELTNIRHVEKLHNLLRLIAFQVGSQVSTKELGT